MACKHKASHGSWPPCIRLGDSLVKTAKNCTTQHTATLCGPPQLQLPPKCVGLYQKNLARRAVLKTDVPIWRQMYQFNQPPIRCHHLNLGYHPMNFSTGHKKWGLARIMKKGGWKWGVLCNVLKMAFSHLADGKVREKRVLGHFNTMQYSAKHCKTLQRTATYCKALWHKALQHTVTQSTATHCDTKHCNTL